MIGRARALRRIRVLTSVYLFGFERPMRGRIGVGAIAVGAHELPRLVRGPSADPRLPRSRQPATNLVITRAPHRGRGLPAKGRGLTLALMTDSKPSVWQLPVPTQRTTRRSQLALLLAASPRGPLVI